MIPLLSAIGVVGKAGEEKEASESKRGPEDTGRSDSRSDLTFL